MSVDLQAIRAECEQALAETNPIMRSRRADRIADDYLDPQTVLRMVAVCEAAIALVNGGCICGIHRHEDLARAVLALDAPRPPDATGGKHG